MSEQKLPLQEHPSNAPSLEASPFDTPEDLWQKGKKAFDLSRIDLAEELLLKAANADHPLAILRLAMLYEHHSQTYPRYKYKLEELSTKFAQQVEEFKAKGLSPEATTEDSYYLGLSYFFGIGQTADQKEGLRLIEDAANKGLDLAQTRLSHLYEQGLGVPRNLQATVE